MKFPQVIIALSVASVSIIFNASAAGLAAWAPLRVAALFGDNMVLQQRQRVPVWGWASPGAAVTVTFSGQTQSTRAAADGKWLVKLSELTASFTPQTLSIESGETRTFTNILVGEVWLASGQSNMEKPLGKRSGQKPTFNAEAELAAANYPNIRIFQVEKILSATPTFMEIAKRVEEHAKGMITPSTMFEEFGFNYTGPIDGHNVDVLVDTLRNIIKLDGPQFLHIATRKGQGYKLAEDDPINYHGPAKFDPKIGLVKASAAVDAKPKPTYTQVFGDWLCDMARADKRLVGITPAMREGSGMVKFSQDFPDRYFDVAIAEQHAVTFAAGLAADGMKPVLAIYSTFLQRGYDQLIHDVAIQNLPVVFALDRGGLVGADGPTHHGAFDLSYLRCIPNITVMTPADENECRQMLFTGMTLDSPSAIRYPRGAGPGVAIEKEMTALAIGKGVLVRELKGFDIRRVAILAFGSMVKPACDAGEELNATVANMRFVKPIDHALVFKLATTHDYFVTVEENVVMGGAGSAVAESLAAQDLNIPILQLGLPDQFVEHGDPAALLADCGLNREGIIQSVRAWLARTDTPIAAKKAVC